MSASRAADLSLVLAAYSRIAAILQESSEVSITEDSLARALRDAASAATRRTGSPAEPIKVSDAARLKAMDVLQKARPELTHSMLVAIIDAAVCWLDDDMDYNAMDFLSAISDEIEVTMYFNLARTADALDHGGRDDLSRRRARCGSHNFRTGLGPGHGQRSQVRDNGVDDGEGW